MGKRFDTVVFNFVKSVYDLIFESAIQTMIFYINTIVWMALSLVGMATGLSYLLSADRLYPTRP